MMIATGDLEPARQPARDGDCGCGGGGSSRASARLETDTGRHAPGTRTRRDPLAALQRNAFYPRKLMEVRHWQAEQEYHRGARELLTRLATGTGILCGLEVYLTDDDTLVIEGGVAVDGPGREIIVPDDIEIDPTQPTDACGRPQGDRLTEGTATIALCYRECGTDVVALPSESCEGESRCVPSMIRESFAVTVRPGAWRREHDSLCEALWGEGGEKPQPPDGDPIEERRLRLDRLAPRECGCSSRCVPLATVLVGTEGGLRLDRRVRTVIRSNAELLELILCLADRLDECCGRTPAPEVVAPKITALFPGPDADAAAVTEFGTEGRLEIAFDRPMSATDLAASASWLGAWVITGKVATRVVLAHRPDEDPGHISAPAGGSAAVYAASLGEPEGFRPEVVAHGGQDGDRILVIMARSGGDGIIRAADVDALALDADYAGTTLTAAQRARLWKIAEGAQGGFSGTASAAPTLDPLPSGDDDPEGELHIVLPIAPPQVADHLRLLAASPAGVEYGGPDATAEEKAELERFVNERGIELIVSGPLSEDSLAASDEWLRAWWAFGEGDRVYRPQRLELAFRRAEDLGDGSVRLLFQLSQFELAENTHIILQLRTDGLPVGADDPHPVLDADWEATALTEETLKRLWADDQFDEGFEDPRRIPPAPPLWDGTPGGIAHWSLLLHPFA
ncbi:hypothetical protein [Microbacterium terricola]|uniref:Uncharacterized protein n=1 Tax=Microbacterium terricola TaxID=344163 RepID=A0ABM8E0S1_9MICO|nr:hypothetical protein [Microbacterium terricola]UYK40725.1 hypothetical protein OAU46_03475 [Microbacterium terricola]BDV31538.1 hypothetical protein Microterr_21980 [Microbacterium terricola]